MSGPGDDGPRDDSGGDDRFPEDRRDRQEPPHARDQPRRDAENPPRADSRDSTTADADGSGADRELGSREYGERMASRESDRPAPEPNSGEEEVGFVRWFFTTEDPVVATSREVASSVLAVTLVGVLLFAISGVWPPLVAVESGSMEPHMHKGDLVFLVDQGRFAPGYATDGVVTYQTGTETGYWSFGDYGNVIIFQPNGQAGTPIIHRARFWVEEGENWVRTKANPEYLIGGDTCREVRNCPAPHDGFITKGDNNRAYDQAGHQSTVVRPRWIRGVAKVRVPLLGCIRLEMSGDSCF